MGKPFIIFGLPRSRTFWLSRFLSYGDVHCGHDQIRYARGVDDVKSWFAQKNVGTAETAGAAWWRLVHQCCPDANIVVVRRSVEKAVDSWMALDMHGICLTDREAVTHQFRYLDHKLDQIEHRLPNVLSVQFADLWDEDVCADVFEHCLPYRHDPSWWASLSGRNMQTDMRAMMRYFFANKPQLDKATAVCKQAVMTHLTKGRRDFVNDGVTFQIETWEQFWKDGQKLFHEHCLSIGEQPDYRHRLNLPLFQKLHDLEMMHVVTARSNGRMLGYLMTLIGPSLENVTMKVGTQTLFFATADANGLHLGSRMQKVAIEAARAANVDEIIMRAGVRGDGPRLGTLYERLGAEPFGDLYRLPLKVA